MAKDIVDERTLAGWLSAPTEARSIGLEASGQAPLIYFADVEEHVQDLATGLTKRCDITLRSKTAALATAEAKRPEVADANDPRLRTDAWKKAVARGLPYFLTCNFRQVAVWETGTGPHQLNPVLQQDLAPGLTHSSSAPRRRGEICDNWKHFLDSFEPKLSERLRNQQRRDRHLPPQAADLREVIVHAAKEAATRIRLACSDPSFRDRVLDTFRAQFGVQLDLDPIAGGDTFFEESEQVAAIGCFVVATRLMLYQALSTSSATHDHTSRMDPLDILRTTADPSRIASDLSALYAHARRRTGDFEIQFATSMLDDTVFVDSESDTHDVGDRWGRIIDTIHKFDWHNPATYVPGLYESLLDDKHRHAMGIHYTPDSVAEVIGTYAVRKAHDVVLDPASGAGTFVTLSYDRKRSLGASHEQALVEVYAVELAEFAASLTGLSLTLADSTAQSAYPRVIRNDFFRTYPGESSGSSLPVTGKLLLPSQVDAVIGNPPYVRFENRSPEKRQEIFKFLMKHYQKTQTTYPDFTGKADLWAFFVAGSQMYLRPGGRLGFVLSWSLLASDYGDAVLAFLGRYFAIDAIIDSRIERWFAAKQNTVILLAQKLDDPEDKRSTRPNPNLTEGNLVRFVRLKQPLESLLDENQPRGKRAEDLVDEILAANSDVGDDLRWDIRVFRQLDLVAVATTATVTEDEESSDSGQ